MKAMHLKDKAVLTQKVSLISQKMIESEAREKMMKENYQRLLKMV